MNHEYNSNVFTVFLESSISSSPVADHTFTQIMHLLLILFVRRHNEHVTKDAILKNKGLTKNR
ncbi:hypothetical protein V1477_017918 [Vespula maculifrons]|uniref:Uncharacterized protein n=1 Tax=Vespula maculifrons TaxID=7453 RepID=A0ABD2AZQ4_VESMC